MAIINSAQSGNFTATSTWVGGVVPTVGDVATVLANHVVTINSAVTCDEVTNANNTGYFDLVDGGVLNANVTGGATVVNQGVVRASMTTAATINGNITVAGALNLIGVIYNSNGTLTVNGNVSFVSGNFTGRAGIYSNIANSKLTMTGNTTANSTSNGTSNGIIFDTSATGCVVSLTGNATAPGSNGGHGLWVASPSSTVTYSGTASQSSVASNGVLVEGANSNVTCSGTFVSSGSGRGIRVSNANTVVASGVFSSTSSNAVGADFSATNVTVNNASLSVNNGNIALSVGVTSGTGTVNVDTISYAGSGGTGLVVSVSTGSLTVNAPNGLTAGGAGSTSKALYAASSGGTVTINANITGAFVEGAGVSTTGTGLIVVNGTVTGNNTVSSVVSPGIRVGVDTSGSLHTTGSRVRVNGNCVAGQYGPGASGFSTLILNGNSVASVQGYVGAAVQRLFIVDNTTYSEQVAEYNGLDGLGNFNNGTISTLVDNATGYPVEANVRQGVSYAAGTFTGTLAVPPTASVAAGVPVDNTVGTAALKLTDVALVTGAQIAAALDND